MGGGGEGGLGQWATVPSWACSGALGVLLHLQSYSKATVSILCMLSFQNEPNGMPFIIIPTCLKDFLCPLISHPQGLNRFFITSH